MSGAAEGACSVAAGRDTVGWRVLVPAALSVARLPFAAAFWWAGTSGRLVLIVAAAASDVLDGMAARWLRVRTGWGSILDAFTDKVFVFVVLVNAAAEGRLAVWQVGLLLVRDAVVGAEAVWVMAIRRPDLQRTEHAAAGKAATALVMVFLAIQLLWPPTSALTRVAYWAAVGANVLAAATYARRWARAGMRWTDRTEEYV